jgi:phospholipase/lecithinase/hemolysin
MFMGKPPARVETEWSLNAGLKRQPKSLAMKHYQENTFTRIAPRALTVFLAFVSISVMAATPFSKIVTFGDSLSDTGNAYHLTGGLYPPSPPHAAGRICDGELWVEHLANTLGMKLGVEDQYAVAGARTDSGNFNALFGLVMLEDTGLQSQVKAYLEDAGAAGADPEALHTLWIGANDIFTTLFFGDKPINQTIQQAVQSTAQTVAKLHSRGARHILVANLPDLGLTPFGQSMGPVFSAQLSALTEGYNAGLKQALDALDASGIRTIRLDTAGLIREIVANPAAFGLQNVTDQALVDEENPKDYLFWNDVHPTSAGHRAVAARTVEELVAFYSPREGRGNGPGLVNSLNGLVKASGKK